jgi:hypothetical protein
LFPENQGDFQKIAQQRAKNPVNPISPATVNLEHNFITVTAQEAKNKKIRRIAINKSLRELFLKLNLTRNGNRYIFINIL